MTDGDVFFLVTLATRQPIMMGFMRDIVWLLKDDDQTNSSLSRYTVFVSGKMYRDEVLG